MSKPVFIDKDAEFLWNHSQEIMDGNPMIGLKFAQIAERLERLNTADMDRLSKGEFAAGALDAMRRIYGRSNLPLEERAMPRPMIAAGLKPTVVPSGATARSLARAEAKVAEEKRKLAKLSGIQLNLSRLTGAK